MVTDFIKHIKIYWKYIKFSLSFEMEYKESFLLGILVDILYCLTTLLSMRVIFWNVDNVAGWTYNEFLILAGVNLVFLELMIGLFFVHNLKGLPSKISKGELDMVLIKPVNSQFQVSMRRPYFSSFLACLVGLWVVYLGFKNGAVVFNLISVFPFLVIFISGIIMAYSVVMIISTLTIWLVGATPIPVIGQSMLELAQNPHSVFKGGWKILFMTFLPVIFMVSFPTSILLGKISLWWVLVSVLMAFIFLKTSNIFWNFALKHYSSASS